MIRNLVFFLALGLSTVVLAQPYHSPFNPQMVDLPKDNGSYSFLVSGHFYGGSASGESGYPASTLLASIDLLNSTKADLFLSTGDMFIDAQADQERYQLAFFNRLNMPLINAVGNHDLDGGNYERLYGKTSFIVELGQDRLIVLDAEKGDSKLGGEEIELLKNAADACETGNLRNVFVITHRPVWAEDIEKYGVLFKENTRSLTGSNFTEDVLPLLERIGQHGQLYWFSGSMGGSAPASIFYVNHSKGIHFLQSAIRDRKQDAVLRAEVTAQGVSFNAISLSGRLMPPVADLGMDFWSARRPTTSFKLKLLPYYLKSSLTHRYFWYGVLVTLLLSVLLKRIYRRLG